MDSRGITRFNPRFRFPLRHKKGKQHTPTTPDAATEPPPSYSECSMFFYAPPSYQESVGLASNRPERRHSINRMSWGSDTSSSSIQSAESSTSSAASSPSPRMPTAPPLSPLSTSNAASSTLSLWLSSVSSSSLRSVENLSRLRHSCGRSGEHRSDSIISTSSTSSPDVITRIQPRLRSWTQCMRWVIQYTLECNFRATLKHFQCLVNEGIRVSQQYEADSEVYPIKLSSLLSPRPTALSIKTWTEFILCMGFKFSQSHIHNINNNNNNNNSEDEEHQHSFLASIFENANNNNNNGTMSEELEELCVVVPRGLAPRQLMKHRDVLTGLLELPYSVIKTAANMSRTETERIITLLTTLIQSSHNTSSVNHASSLDHALSVDHALPVDHALVKSIWDIHRRPGFFLLSLDFVEFRQNGGRKFLRIPAGAVARRRFYLAKETLEMFLRN